MITLENALIVYTVVVTSIILWNFFKTQAAMKNKLEGLYQDFYSTVDGIYRTMDEHKNTTVDDMAAMRREFDAEIASIYRTIERMEEENSYSSSKK